MIKIKSKFCTRAHIFKRLFSISIDNEIEILKKDVMNSFAYMKEKKYIDLKSWNLYQSTPENFNQSMANIFLFPGQGTQFVGMGKKLIATTRVQRLFESASEVLKYDLKKICFEGPSEKLGRTLHCQPAIFVTSLGAIEKIREEQPELIENCIAAAGISLGEITALVFSGSLSFEDGLRFIDVRSKVSEEACSKVKSGLMVVHMGPRSNINEAMLAAKQYCYEKLKIEKPVCQISNYLFTECRTIGGHVEALDFIQTFAKDFHLKAARRLDVAGAFHTPLMDEAYASCLETLKDIHVKEPRINVMSNVTGTVYSSSKEIKRLLPNQINHPVRWEQILHRLYMRPPEFEQPTTYEIGPSSNTVRKVNAAANKRCRTVEI